jgi:hypothetical protein
MDGSSPPSAGDRRTRRGEIAFLGVRRATRIGDEMASSLRGCGYGQLHASGVTAPNAGCPELSFTGSAKPDRSLLTPSHARRMI